MRLPHKPWDWWALRVVTAIVFALGLFGLWRAVTIWVAVGAGVVAAIAAFPQSWGPVGRLLGAGVAATMSLVGFDVIVNGALAAVGVGRLPIVLGLGVALVVFSVAAYVYLRGARWRERHTRATAVALAIVALLVAPACVALLTPDPTRGIAKSERVGAALDVLILTDGTPRAAPSKVPADPALRGFDIEYAVGYADGTAVHWTLRGTPDAGAALEAISQGRTAPDAPAPTVRDDSDAVLVLVVNDTHPSQVGRWRRVKRSAAPPGTPVFALLPRTSAARRALFHDAFGEPGGVTVQQDPLTALAARLAINAPTADDDFTLALAHRPILLFDGSETVPRPLSVSALFDAGRIELCQDRHVAGTQCDVVHDPSRLYNGGTHLQITPPPRSRGLAGSAIYVHPFAVQQGGRSLLYLDYWWYLPDNPAATGAGSFCGAGLVIPGVTCYDHQSDWEGMTVVVDRTTDVPAVRSVQYAQHEEIVAYDWPTLRDRWANDSRYPAWTRDVADAGKRPLAFIAGGTHATYAMPCQGNCRQVAVALGEEPHRGNRPWAGNGVSACGTESCLQMLPTRFSGAQPALWNAFVGVWGNRHCWLRFYCDSGSPPAAPGTQLRYRNPTATTAAGR